LIRLLLDTHIWVWTVSEPERISRRVAQELKRLDSELWLSPVSIWELIILSEKGRVEFAGGVEEWTTRALRSLPLIEAPVTNEVAREVGRLRLSHRDPADHFLVATAKVFDLTLVTADELLMKVADVEVLANR
jgi:PIN domain nuclease of toxin-antitoxin system